MNPIDPKCAAEGCDQEAMDNDICCYRHFQSLATKSPDVVIITKGHRRKYLDLQLRQICNHRGCSTRTSDLPFCKDHTPLPRCAEPGCTTQSGTRSKYCADHAKLRARKRKYEEENQPLPPVVTYDPKKCHVESCTRDNENGILCREHALNVKDRIEGIVINTNGFRRIMRHGSYVRLCNHVGCNFRVSKAQGYCALHYGSKPDDSTHHPSKLFITGGSICMFGRCTNLQAVGQRFCTSHISPPSRSFNGESQLYTLVPKNFPLPTPVQPPRTRPRLEESDIQFNSFPQPVPDDEEIVYRQIPSINFDMESVLKCNTIFETPPEPIKFDPYE